MPFTGPGASYDHYKEYQIPGSAIDGAHTDFVVHFSRTDADLAAACRSDGNDIIFCDTSDNQLDHHLVYWDQGTGRIQARVRLTTVDATAYTLRVYYGKASQTTATQNIAGTYGSNYEGVWFFDGSSTVAEQLNDINTDFAADGTPTFTWSDTWGVGASCDGSTDGYTAPDVAYSTTNQSIEIALSTENIATGTSWSFLAKRTGTSASQQDILFGMDTNTRIRTRMQLTATHAGTLSSVSEWVNSQTQRMISTWLDGALSTWSLYGEDTGAGLTEVSSNTSDRGGNTPSWNNSGDIEVMQASSTDFVEGVLHWLLISPVAFSYEYLLTQDLVVKANPLTVTTAEQTNSGGVEPASFSVPVAFGTPTIVQTLKVEPASFSVPVVMNGTDQSEGLEAAANATATIYGKANNTNAGTVSTWHLAIGGTAAASGTPAHNATGRNGSPTVDFAAADEDYFDITSQMGTAAQAADPNRAWSVAMLIRRTTTASGQIVGFGDTAEDFITYGWSFTGTGKLAWFARRTSGAFDDSIQSSGTVPLDTDISLVCTYRGNEVRATYYSGGTETVIIAATSTAALSAANYPFTECFFGALPRTTLNAVSARVERFIAFPGESLSDAEMTALHVRLAELEPSGATSVEPVSFSVPVTFGAPTVAPNLTALPPAFSVPVTFGSPSVAPVQEVSPAAFSVPVAFGTPSVATGKIYALGTNAHGFSFGVSGSGNTTLAHTLVAGPSRVMRIVAIARANSTTPTFNSVTYGGVTATLAHTIDSTAVGQTIWRASIYYVLEADLPADGSNDIVLNRNFGSSTRVALFGSLIADAAQAAPGLPDPVASNSSGTSIAADVTGVVDGAWVLGAFVLAVSSDPTWNDGQVEYFDDNNGTERLSGGELKGADGETSLSVSFSSTSSSRGFIVASFAPLDDNQTVFPNSFAVPVAFGAPVVGNDQSITPPAFSVPVTFGAPDVAERTIPPAFSVPVVFGAPAVFTGATPPSFTVDVVFGTPVVTTPPIVEPSSFSVPVVFGAPVVTTPNNGQEKTPRYFLVPVQFGVPSVNISGAVAPDAFAVPVVFGVPTLTFAAVTEATFADTEARAKAIRIRLPRKISDWKTGAGEEKQLKEQLHQFEKAIVDTVGHQVPDAIEKAGLFDLEAHAPTHILDGSDPIDADQLGVDYEPTNYTPATVADIATSLMHLAAHLAGIDTALLNVEPHGDTHEVGGTDEISVQDLGGVLSAAQKVTVRKNGSAGSAFTAIDFIEGANITLTLTTTGGENNLTIAASVGAHAPTHIRGGSDEIDGDMLDVDYVPSGYTRSVTAPATSLEHLAAHLAGISAAFAGKASTAHASTHITAGSDEIDGDRLDIDWNPTNYSPTTAPAEVTSLDHLVAHLAGIDNRLIHANTHTREGSDPIDGDLLDIDYSPNNYTRSTGTPGSNAEHLAAHLRGIDNTFPTKASTDGDVLHISWSPSNYTPTTAPTEVSNTNQLTAHLAGIDDELAGLPTFLSGAISDTLSIGAFIISGTITGAVTGNAVIANYTGGSTLVTVMWARVSAPSTVQVCIDNRASSSEFVSCQIRVIQ